MQQEQKIGINKNLEIYAMVVWTFIAIIFVIGVGRAALSNNMETGNEEEK